MIDPIVLAARVERYHTHIAVCRYRRQGLACSTCSDFAESAERAAARLVILHREVA